MPGLTPDVDMDHFGRRVSLTDSDSPIYIWPGQRALILADGRDLLGEVGPGPLDEYVRQARREGPARRLEAVIYTAAPADVRFDLAGLATADGAQVDLICTVSVRVVDAVTFLANVMRDREAFTLAELHDLLESPVRDALRRQVAAHTLARLAEDLSLRDRFAAAVEYALTQGVDQLRRSGLAFEGITTADYRCQVEDEVKRIRGAYYLQIAAKEAEMAGRRRYADLLRQEDEQALAEEQAQATVLRERAAAMQEVAWAQEDYAQARQRREELLSRWAVEVRAPTPLMAPELWTYDLGEPVYATPALDGGTLYVATRAGRIVAFRPGDEAGVVEPRWDVRLPARVEGGLALSGDRLLVPGSAGEHGALYQLDTATGDIVAECKTTGRLRAAPLIAGDVAYLAGEDGSLVVADIGRGCELRGRQLSPQGLRARPALHREMLYIGGRDNQLYAVARGPLEGRPIFRAQHQILCPVTVDERGGLLYVADLAGYVYALDSHGRVQWKWQAEGGPDRQIVAELILEGGRLYVAAGDGNLYALDLAGKNPPKVAWRYPASGYIAAAPARWRELLFVGDNSGHLHALDRAGVPFWRYDAGGRLLAVPQVTPDGVLLLATDAGRVIALPWHRGHTPEAAQRLEAWGDHAAAGNLWLQAGEGERARLAFERAGDHGRAAAVSRNLGRYAEAAGSYEMAAAAHRTRAPETAAAFYAQAAETWDQERNDVEARRCRKLDAELRRAPLLIIEPAHHPSVPAGGQAYLTVVLRNEGFSLAESVILYAGGDVQRRVERRLPPLAPGQSRPEEFPINPSASGTARVSLTAVYCDAGGQAQAPAHAILHITVQPQPQEHVHYHGPVVRGDGVIIVRGASSGGARLTVQSGNDKIETGLETP